MGYFGNQVGRAVVQKPDASTPRSAPPVPGAAQFPFAAQVGKGMSVPQPVQVNRCPRCQGTLVEEDGWMRCTGRCARRWVSGGSNRWLDPATLPFGVCGCCRPRLPLVVAEVGAICPHSHAEYLVLPEGVRLRSEAAPWGICRCCLPPQPLVQVASGLTCRNKPQQHYKVEQGEVVWIGLAPGVDQAAVTAAIDAALAANNAELTLFGLFAPPGG